MVALIVVGFGLFGLSKLRLNLYPDVSFPTITVYTVYEGVAPEDIETLVTRPIEERVGSVSGVIKMRSLSSQGASVVKLYFDWDTDLFEAQIEVRKQLDFIRRELPLDVEQPIVFNYDPNQEPVVVLTMSSDYRSTRELRTFATRQIEPLLERIPGTASATTVGGLDRQISVQLNPISMRQYNVSIGEISGVLQRENVQVPAGELIEGSTIFSLRTLGEFKTVEQIAATVVAVRDGNPVRLEDVAKVDDGVAQPIGGVHVDGDDGLIINVYKQSDANIVTAASGIVGKLDDLRKVLPKDVDLDILTNRADFINQSISNLYMTALQAIILVVLILLFFLQSWRSAVVIAVSIPVSIIATFSVMNWADLSLNVISLSGLTLAVGMVVDDAVVVLENIFQRKQSGEPVISASVRGAKEVAVPVVISTLTTLVVFLPILFVPGIAGVLFRDLALTVSFALSMSSLVALSLIPLMSSRMLSEKEALQEQEIPEKFLARLRYRIGSVFSTAGSFIKARMAPVGVFFQNLGDRLGIYISRLEQSYEDTLKQLLPRSGLVVLLAALVFFASVPLFLQLSRDFFPPVDESRFTLEVIREPGVNLFELERTVVQVEDLIKQEVPEARLVVAEYGDKPGVEGADNPGGFYSTIRVELLEPHLRDRTQFEIVSDVLAALNTVPGAEIKELRKNPLSPDGENGLIVYVYGFDAQRKALLANEVKQRLGGVQGIVNVSSTSDESRPELRVTMNRERVSRLGLSTSQVATAISDAVRGNRATTFVDDGLSFDIVVELEPRFKASQTALEELPVQVGETWVPLKHVADIQRIQGPTNILRINQERVTEIRADLAGLDLKTASDITRDVLSAMDWPDGYRFELSGTAEEQARSFYYLLIAFSIASVLTYMVMASQFESFTEPFIMLLTIPLALSGVLIVLWATQTPVSVTAMIGLVLLAGIVVNNGIVMIDYIKILQIRGLSREDAITQGAARRLRPILMTAGTTVLSMVPLALELGVGSETWSPMARTVIGGLVASTLLMLFVVPCLYYLLNRMVEAFGFTKIRKVDPLAAEASV